MSGESVANQPDLTTRRAVLAGVGGMAITAGLPRVARPAGNRVVVIGAGLAGLAAAYELKQAGVEVRIAEQSARAGGRVLTVRGHFDDTAVELGGQAISSSYTNFVDYCELFELDIAPQVPRETRPDVLLHLQGKTHSLGSLRDDSSRWPIDLSSAERQAAPFRLLGNYLGPVAKEIGTPDRVLHADFADYDQMSLQDFLLENGASPAALKFINHVLNYNDLTTVSALGALRDATRLLQSPGATLMDLAGGTAALSDAFAERLSDELALNTTLIGIATADEGLRLRMRSSAGFENWQCDRMILALPFSALRDIDMTPEWAADKKEMIAELPYTQIVRTYLLTDSRFWESGSPVAAIYSDGPVERYFDSSRKLQSSHGLLQNWVNGTGVAAISELPDKARIDFVVAHLKKMFPQAQPEILQTLSIDWGQTYCKGAYAHFAPGQLTRFSPTIAKPVGAIHFAGEHTELVAPGLEGAVVSGRRAALEVLHAA